MFQPDQLPETSRARWADVLDAQKIPRGVTMIIYRVRIIQCFLNGD